MKALKVRIENGRISDEAPPGLPDVDHELCLDDGDDDMSEEDLAHLDVPIERAMLDAKEGRVVPASEVIAELRARRG